MQWESGRTWHNLLQVVRGGKAKRQTTSRVLRMHLHYEYGMEQRKGRRNLLPVAFKSCLPTLDNLRNFFLTPMTEMPNNVALNSGMARFLYTIYRRIKEGGRVVDLRVSAAL